jgi:uncharacterized membrane protein
VTITLLITLVGGLLLFLSDRQMAGRLAMLERELAALRAQLAGRAPSELSGAAEPSQRPAAPERAPRPSPDPLPNLFERVVGGRLLIWTGAVALAAGGVFLIRHSIELVSPGVRMLMAAVLGLVLIGAGEVARRGRLLSGDRRIAQGLIGAGIAVLYATVWGSHLLFALIGAGVAAAAMVLITAAAFVLALRHGAPTAALGLVGGFSTPLLAGDPEASALPVLAYLALLNGAIFTIALRRRWRWLVTAAVAASFAWTGFFILRPVEAGYAASDALAAGFAAALLGTLASLPRAGPLLSRLPPAIIASAEVALLVARGDAGVAGWLLFGAMAGVSLPLAALRPEQRSTPVAALAIALALLAFQAGLTEDPAVPWAAALTTLLFAGGLLAAAPRNRAAALAVCAALVGPLLVLRLLRPELLPLPGYGLIALLLSAAALGLLSFVRKNRSGHDVRDAAAFTIAGTATLLAAVGARDLVPADYLSAAWLLIAVALLLAGVKLGDMALRVAGLALLTLTVCKVFVLDADELRGVLRILSFLGLGLALIGIGLLYGKVLGRKHGGTPLETPTAQSSGRMRPPDASETGE